MTPQQFVNAYIPYARQTEEKTGISAIAVLAQAALESGWGKHAPGNMFFGKKDSDGHNGNEQLLTTTEYHSTINVKYPEVLKIVPVVISGRRLFKYTVKDWFRKYDTPEQCFTDHAKLIAGAARYKPAMQVAHDPIAFVKAIHKAGYATAPNYSQILEKIIRMIQKHV